MSLQKSELRALMRARRKKLSSAEKQAAAQALSQKLVTSRTLQNRLASGGVCAVYLASPDELDLTEALETFLSQAVTLAAPRWDGEKYVLAQLVSLRAEDLRVGPMGILEPKVARLVAARDVALWLVPGLAFTLTGFRLGYGGGWYDRMLAEAATDALKLGIAYPFQVVETLPHEKHDVQLSRIVVAGK